MKQGAPCLKASVSLKFNSEHTLDDVDLIQNSLTYLPSILYNNVENFSLNLQL